MRRKSCEASAQRCSERSCIAQASAGSTRCTKRTARRSEASLKADGWLRSA